jgi:hypothetical protein
MPMFIPKRVAYLSSSIAHYERWFLMRADFVAPPFALEPRPHLTRRCSEPQAAVMTSSQHVYEVRPRKDHPGVNLISAPKFRMIRHNSPMTPLLSGDCDGSERIRRNNSVKDYGKIPSTSR